MTAPVAILLTVGGLAFLGAAVLLGIQTLYQWATGENVSGFATVILLLLIIGSAVMIGLGVIGALIDELEALDN